MSNEYYTPSGSPTTNSDGSSAVMRAEFASIQAGLDKLPVLAANGDKAVFVNAGGTALTAVAAATALTKLGAQPADVTLTSLSALGTTADRVAYTTGVDTWAETPLTAAGRALIDDASAAAQRTTLGVVIGADVQAFDATLTSLAALGTAADKMPYTTGVDTWAEAAITSAGRALLDDASAAAQLTTLGTTAFNTFVSTDQTITQAGALTLAHGLGVAPRITLIELVCQTAELGYSIGDVVQMQDNSASMVKDATNINVRYRNSNIGLIHKTTGVFTSITFANWKARFLAIK